MINLWIGNLGKYNEGELVGEWIELPFDEDEWNELLDRIQICNENTEHCDEFGQPYEEWFIADYETDIPGLEIGEYSNVEELNELAEMYEQLDNNEQIACRAYLQNGSSLETAIDEARRGNYIVWLGCDSMKDVAWNMMEENRYLAERGEIPQVLIDHFDYESYGNELETSRIFVAVDEGYVEMY